MAFFEAVWTGILATSIVEWLAFVTGILYVILAAKESIWCWLFAFISSALFVYLCLIGQLYLESTLQFFYVIMAVIGYVSWNTKKESETRIKTWTFQQHALNIVISGAITIVLGFLFSKYTNQAAPYIDSFTTVFSLAATFMVTRKVIGNWMYWIIIDLFSVYLYDSRGYQLLAVQMFIFTVLAAFAYMSWRKKLKAQLA